MSAFLDNYPLISDLELWRNSKGYADPTVYKALQRDHYGQRYAAQKTRGPGNARGRPRNPGKKGHEPQADSSKDNP